MVWITGVFVSPDGNAPARQPVHGGCRGIVVSLILLVVILMAFSYAVLLPMDPSECPFEPAGVAANPCRLGRGMAVAFSLLVLVVFYVTSVIGGWKRGLVVVACIFGPVATVLFVLSKSE